MPRSPYASHETTRRALARTIDRFDKDEDADVGRFRAIVYAYGVILSFFKHADDLSIEQEIAEIRRRLDEHGIGTTSNGYQQPRIVP